MIEKQRWNSVSDLSIAKNLIDSEIVLKKEKPFIHDAPFNDVDISNYNNILDFGAGVGRYIPEILRRKNKNACIYAYDFPNMIKLAKEYLGEKTFNNVLWLQPPIQSIRVSKYDLIVASVVFQHINPKELANILCLLNECMTTNGVLWVFSRGYNDYSNLIKLPSVMSMINEYFEPASEVDLEDDSERHQTAIFVKRKILVKRINPFHWTNLNLENRLIRGTLQVLRRLRII